MAPSTDDINIRLVKLLLTLVGRLKWGKPVDVLVMPERRHESCGMENRFFVALKFLPEDVARDLRASARFRREAQGAVP